MDQAPILCKDVVKTFAVRDAQFAWRVLFGLAPHGKQVHALSGVSLLVPKGKIVGILGRNGAGKSTLLRVIGGVSAPSSGLIRLGGDVASLFELGGLGTRFITGREYARRFLELQGADIPEISRLTSEIADFAELGAYFDRRIVTYSSGMAARLYFSTATARQSQIYLIDEVLTVGDAHFAAKCWARLRSRLAKGASGLLVTHDWSAALKLCEESHVLNGGRIVRSGRTDRVVVEYLDLPKPPAAGARFLLSTEETFHVESGADAELRIPLEVNLPLEFFFAYSVELMRIGFGWEVMLLSDFLPIEAALGRHEVVLRIPRLPLAPGHYVLNLFLSARASGQTTEPARLEPCDVRSWTYGNGLTLSVSGPSVAGVVRLPVSWELH